MSVTAVNKLYEKLNTYHNSHYLFDSYYEGFVDYTKSNSSPPILSQVRTVCGWPSTCVDVLEERCDFQGWDDEGKYGLEDIYTDNSVGYETSMSNIDCLMYGISFMAVSTGRPADLEPAALITAESPKDTTGVWNRRTRRLDVAFTRYADPDGAYTRAGLFLPDSTQYFARLSENSPWYSMGKPDNHRLGRVPVVRQINRGRAGRRQGKSEITRAIRYYTDVAVRTLFGMEVNREFYSSPQRYVLGAKEAAFIDEQGNPIPGWRAIQGALWNIERDSDMIESTDGRSDGLPEVGQFSANPPGPYLEQVRGLSMLVAAETGMPPSYLGFVSDNPPSADSIRALESRLVKRAERRISAWDADMVELGQLAAMIAGPSGAKVDKKNIITSWRDPATPTRAADADRAAKLVTAQIIPANSRVAWEMAGLTPKQMKQLEKDKMRATADQILMEGMRGVPTSSGDQPGNPTPSKPVVEEPAA